MKIYNIKKAKQFIKDHKSEIIRVSLGMQEDWNWTAEVIWGDGKYTQKIDKNSSFGSITGSTWATPVMEIIYKDKERVLIDCYSGESNGERPLFF